MGYTVIKNSSRNCIKCLECKSLDFFHAYAYTTKQGNRSVRYSSYCKTCQSIKDKKRRLSGNGKHKELSKKWRENNREHHLAILKEYRQSDKGKAKKAELQRLREKNMNRTHLTKEEREQVDAIYMAARELQRLIDVCPIFNDPLLGKEVHVDHIIPIAKGGKHIPSNLQPMLATFNRRKGAR